MESHAAGMSNRSRVSKPPRKKACGHCTSAKARCDHARPSCSRCIQRRLNCSYGGAMPSPSTSAGSGNNLSIEDGRYESNQDNDNDNNNTGDDMLFQDQLDPDLSAGGLFMDLGEPHTRTADTENQAPSTLFRTTRQADDGQGSLRTASLLEEDQDPLDFSSVRLLPNIDSNMVASRWASSFFATPLQRRKVLSRCTLSLILNIFRAYPETLALPTLPPFVHWSQVIDGDLPKPLANCASIAVMWQQRAPSSEELVRKVIVSEMDALYKQSRVLDALTQLACFQAYLLLALMLLPTSWEQKPLLQHDTMLLLQQFAGAVTERGLVSEAEEQGYRPSWESWILAEARRRTVVTVYILDDLVNLTNEQLCITGEELGRLPITSGKMLWNATTRTTWQNEYDRRLSWGGAKVKMSDLWRQSEDNAARSRLSKWIPTMDEFGMTVYAVANDAHTK